MDVDKDEEGFIDLDAVSDAFTMLGNIYDNLNSFTFCFQKHKGYFSVLAYSDSKKVAYTIFTSQLNGDYEATPETLDLEVVSGLKQMSLNKKFKKEGFTCCTINLDETM